MFANILVDGTIAVVRSIAEQIILADEVKNGN